MEHTNRLVTDNKTDLNCKASVQKVPTKLTRSVNSVVTDIDDEKFWRMVPLDEKKEIPWVELSFEIGSVSHIDTVSCTVFICLYVAYYWTDARIAGWNADESLPPSLWAPKLFLTNMFTNGDQQLRGESDGISLIDTTMGRLICYNTIQGTIANTMDLRMFPFDVDEIDIRFESWSHGQTANGENIPFTPGPKAYRLRQSGSSGVRLVGEGKFLECSYWDGFIDNEWEIQGLSSKIEDLPLEYGHGHEVTSVVLAFHVSRKSAYYFWKALLPLYLLTVLSMSTFHFETDNLSDRNATISTYFLAAFAMLYVVGASLPKTNFLTKLDKVVVATTLSLAFTGIASLILFKIHNDSGQEIAERWNLILELALIATNVLLNIWLLIPPFLWQYSTVRQLRNYKSKINYFESGLVGTSSPDITPANSENNDYSLPPIIEKGRDYVSWTSIKG